MILRELLFCTLCNPKLNKVQKHGNEQKDDHICVDPQLAISWITMVAIISNVGNY